MIPIPSDTSWPGFDALKAWLKRQTISFSKVVTGTLNVDQVMQSSNYASGTSGWMVDGAGDAEFNDVTVRGDIISANWDGTVPLSLPDAAATQGFALQSSNGAAQFAGSLDIGGEVTLDGTLNVLSGKITTGTPSLTSGTVLEVAGYSSSAASIDFYKNESIVGFLRYTTTPDQVSLYSGTTLFLLSPTITVAGKIVGAQFEDGDTSNPGVAFYSNTDSGLRYESSGVDDGIYYVVDGTDVGRISSEGAEFYTGISVDGPMAISSSGTDIASFGNGASYPGLSLTRPMQTGQTSYTRRPWNNSTICLGNYAYVGTPGSYMGGIWWNWERGTDSGYYSLSVNGFTSAYGVLLGDSGILFVGDDPWGETGTPTTRMTLTGAGDLTLHTGDLSVNGSISGASLGVTGAISGASLSVTGLASASSAMRSNVFEFASDTDTQISYSSSGIGNFYSNGTIVGQWGPAGLFSGTLTTSNSPNVYMSSSSLSAHYRFTSAAKYKTQVTDEQDYLASLTLRPVKFYREDSDSWHYGYIADELAAQDKLFGVYDEKGEIESYDWIEIIAVLGAKVNRADARIEELERTIEELERTIVKGAGR